MFTQSWIPFEIWSNDYKYERLFGFFLYFYNFLFVLQINILLLLFLTTVSHNPDWAWTLCVVEIGLKCLIFMPPSSKSGIAGVYFHTQLHECISTCCLCHLDNISSYFSNTDTFHYTVGKKKCFLIRAPISPDNLIVIG